MQYERSSRSINSRTWLSKMVVFRQDFHVDHSFSIINMICISFMLSSYVSLYDVWWMKIRFTIITAYESSFIIQTISNREFRNRAVDSQDFPRCQFSLCLTTNNLESVSNHQAMAKHYCHTLIQSIIQSNSHQQLSDILQTNSNQQPTPRLTTCLYYHSQHVWFSYMQSALWSLSSSMLFATVSTKQRYAVRVSSVWCGTKCHLEWSADDWGSS